MASLLDQSKAWQWRLYSITLQAKKKRNKQLQSGAAQHSNAKQPVLASRLPPTCPAAVMQVPGGSRG